MISLDIAVPAEDVRKLSDRVGRYVSFLGGDAQKAVESTAVLLVRSLRDVTKRRPAIKKRPVVKNPLYTSGKATAGGFSKRDRQKEHISDYYTLDRKRPDLDFVSFKDTSSRFKAKKAVFRIKKSRYLFPPIYSGKGEKAKDNPLREIKKAGLAANTWGLIIGKLAGGAVGRMTPATAKGTAVLVVKEHLAVTIWNKLPYIRKALTTSQASVVQRVDKQLWYKMLDASDKAAVKAGLLHYPG